MTLSVSILHIPIALLHSLLQFPFYIHQMLSNQFSLLAKQAIQSTIESRTVHSNCYFSPNHTQGMCLEHFQELVMTMALSDDNQFPCDLNLLSFQESGLFFTQKQALKIKHISTWTWKHFRGDCCKCGMNFLALLWLLSEKKGSVLNSLFVRRCACSPWGEATLLFHQIKWSEAVPFQEEPIKLFKEVYYCDVLWNHSHQDSLGCVLRQGVNVCTLTLHKLIKRAVDSSFPFAK